MSWLRDFAESLGLSLPEAAYLFSAGGGVTTPSDWMGLDRDERGALIASHQRLRIEQAVRIGQAARGHQGAVVAPLDGGVQEEAEADFAALADFRERLEGELGGGRGA